MLEFNNLVNFQSLEDSFYIKMQKLLLLELSNQSINTLNIIFYI